MGNPFDLGDLTDKPDEKRNEVLSEVLDLYNDIIKGDSQTLEKSAYIYWKEYSKLLNGLKRTYDNGFISKIPDYLYDLLVQYQSESQNIYLKSSSEIKIIEIGLKKILKKSGLDLPLKEESKTNNNLNPNPNITNIYQNQSMQNTITITNDIKLEVDEAIKDFEKEIEKPKPDKSIVKKSLEVIKKGADYGFGKILEVLLKKFTGI